MVSDRPNDIVKVLHVSTIGIEYIIPESFHFLHVSARWAPKISVHMDGIGGWLPHELLGS